MTLGLIGLKKDIDISIRERLSIVSCEKKEILRKFSAYFNEAIVLSTCNRTEIYIEYDSLKDEEIFDIVFDTLSFNKELKEFVFLKKGLEVPKHLYEVACGFHSKILGEDQILGQIREAYLLSLEEKTSKIILGRMFQGAISCSRDFKAKARLYEIPVSSISIVADKFKNMNVKKIMILGFGEVGKLAVKYLLSSNIKCIYIVVRNKLSVDSLFDNRIKVITFKEKNKYINDVDGIIGCTSAPHAVVHEGDIKETGKDIYCFDMAIPRDIHKNVLKLRRVKSYNIDEISRLNDKNKKLRKDTMNKYKYIVTDELKDFSDFLKYREIAPSIKEMKDISDKIYLRRYNTYLNKRKYFYKEKELDALDLEDGNFDRDKKATMKMIKSTSDYYLHRAIEVLKEEKLKGCEEECLKILKKIFIQETK